MLVGIGLVYSGRNRLPLFVGERDVKVDEFFDDLAKTMNLICRLLHNVAGRNGVHSDAPVSQAENYVPALKAGLR